MSPNTIPKPDPLPTPTPHAWIGLDWGHHTHAFALLDHTGHREEGTLPQSAESLHQWAHQLEARFGGHPVFLALETSRGAVIQALIQYPWLTLYPINPVTSARYRKAFIPSGASDDLPDARLLLDLLQTHAAQCRPLEPEDPLTRQLTALVEARRAVVNRRTQVLNQLTTLLRTYYPQALELVGDLDSTLALDFLQRWPDLITLKTAKADTLRHFYYGHNLRRPELVTQRLERIRSAVALTTDPACVDVAVLQLHSLLDQLRPLRKHVARFDTEIQRVFAKHPEADLFRNLPGAGSALAPRLGVAFGTVRTRYPDPASLQKYAGVAPVREKSGRQLWTHWRWQAPCFLRQTWVEWAGQTVVYSAWAKAYYQHMLAQGKRRQAILRALAFKWIRVLWKCWQTHTPYDETRYLQQLRRRGSPYAQAV